MDIMSILAVLKWFIASLIVYGVLSLFVGIFIGILQYFKIKSNSGSSLVQYHSRHKTSALNKLIKKAVVFFFYGRLTTALLGLLTYRLKGWSRKVVYNHMFNNNYRFWTIKDVGVRFCNLISNKYPNGFYTYPRGTGGLFPAGLDVDDIYKKNKGPIFTKLNHNSFAMGILFPIAFAIWLYQNDRHRYDMSAEKIDNKMIYEKSTLGFLPKFISDKCNPELYVNNVGSYLNVGDNQVKERAIISFLLDRIFIDEYTNINFSLYFDYQL